MNVIKRNGQTQPVSFDKILRRITNLSDGLKGVDRVTIAQKVIERLHDGITTTQLDDETAKIASNLESVSLDYGALASRILVSNLQKSTPKSFTDYIQQHYPGGNVADYLYLFGKKFGDKINAKIVDDRDFGHDYFGLKTLEKLYLQKNKNQHVVERPQYLWMRVGLSVFREDIHGRLGYYELDGLPSSTQTRLLKRFSDSIVNEKFVVTSSDNTGEYRKRVVDTSAANIDYDGLNIAVNGLHPKLTPDFTDAFGLYDAMSQGLCTMATPTLFNFGTGNDRGISCYLKKGEDSVDGMYSNVRDIALLFQSAGGVGFSVSSIRGNGSLIKSSNGSSEGLVPYLRTINDTSRHIRQGGRRNGSLVVSVEPWHVDTPDIIMLKKPTGEEKARARDLFYAMWIPDAFLRAIERDDWWYLMTPDECPGLNECYGEDFDKLYYGYVKQGRYRRKLRAQYLWDMINESCAETGAPYLLAKDEFNKKSMQKNIGIIESSNLCCEIGLHSSFTETACCTLASLGLSKMVTDGAFNYTILASTTRLLVRALNRVIDLNNYPNEKTKRSNHRHRPIGIGEQGLADVFMKCRIGFESPEARELNCRISECIYYHAVDESVECSKRHRLDLIREVKRRVSLPLPQPDKTRYTQLLTRYTNDLRCGAYSTFVGSPYDNGKLQPDLWGKDMNVYGLMGYDYDALKTKIKTHGIRNSTLVALMPTASTSIILGNNECFDPPAANIYKRQTLSGEFMIHNKYLINDLVKLGLWTPKLRDTIIALNGSIQAIPSIPNEIKKIYKTVYELPQRVLVDLAADRGPFVCQSQSMSLYFANVDANDEKSKSQAQLRFTKAAFYAWKKGLKTIRYYTRTRPATTPIKFAIDIDTISEAKVLKEKDSKSKTRASSASPRGRVPSVSGDPVDKAPVGYVCTDDICTMCSS